MKTTVRQLGNLADKMAWRTEVVQAVFGCGHDEARALATRVDDPCADVTFCQADADGCPAGCGALCLQHELPSPDNPTGRCAFLMNIYVRPRYRRLGIGRSIVAWLVDRGRRMGCGKIYLETTDAGRKLYESAGFAPMDGLMVLDDTAQTPDAALDAARCVPTGCGEHLGLTL